MASKGRGRKMGKSSASKSSSKNSRPAPTKARPRPTARANARRQQRQQRPMPQPPARRPTAAQYAARPAAAVAAGNELASRVSQLQNEFASLEAKAQLSEAYDAIGRVDQRLLDLPATLETLRDQGYVHSGNLEDELEALDDKWDDVRPQVEAALNEHVQRLDRELDQAERQIDRLQASASSVRLGESLVNGLSRRIEAATAALEGLYGGLSGELDKMNWQLDKLTKMMSLIAESPHIRLVEGEGPLTAVEAVWLQNGDDGPEGVLVLTDQRIFFEERDEVVTKRRFGIFKAETEKVQELHIVAQVSEIQAAEAKEEGGFLGMGKDDILELVFAATAPVSRARFHLKGQDSADWSAYIKKIQTGEIDGDRADKYLEELATLAETAASFPTACPNCFAAVEPPARGVTSVTCAFCGTIITPETPAE